MRHGMLARLGFAATNHELTGGFAMSSTVRIHSRFIQVVDMGRSNVLLPKTILDTWLMGGKCVCIVWTPTLFWFSGRMTETNAVLLTCNKSADKLRTRVEVFEWKILLSRRKDTCGNLVHRVFNIHEIHWFTHVFHAKQTFPNSSLFHACKRTTIMWKFCAVLLQSLHPGFECRRRETRNFGSLEKAHSIIFFGSYSMLKELLRKSFAGSKLRHIGIEP